MSSNGPLDSDDELDGHIDHGVGHRDEDGSNAFTNKNIQLNITTSYQPTWRGKEGFREIWQNW
jgi:hypothetical protein